MIKAGLSAVDLDARADVFVSARLCWQGGRETALTELSTERDAFLRLGEADGLIERKSQLRGVVLKLVVKERAPLRTTAIGVGAIEVGKIASVGEDDFTVKIRDPRDRSMVLGSVKLTASLCKEFDELQVSVEAIRAKISFDNRRTEPELSALASPTRASGERVFFCKVRSGTVHFERKLRDSSTLQQRRFDFSDFQESAVFVEIEEIQDRCIVGSLSLDGTKLSPGTYFFKDKRGNCIYEASLTFARIPKPLKLEAALSVPETEDDCERRGCRGEPGDSRKATLAKPHKRRSNSATALPPTDSAATVKSLERQVLRLQNALQVADDKNRALEDQLARRGCSLAKLDHVVSELETENQHLKKTVQLLAPHWDRVEFRASASQGATLSPALAPTAPLTPLLADPDVSIELSQDELKPEIQPMSPIRNPLRPGRAQAHSRSSCRTM